MTNNEQQLVAYSNKLSVIVTAQLIEIRALRQQLDINTEMFHKYQETIEAMTDAMCAIVGKIDVFDAQRYG